MKYSLTMKFIALVLCALMLLGAAACGVSLIGLGASGLLGEKSIDEVLDSSITGDCYRLADDLAHTWASGEYGGMPSEMRDATIRSALRDNDFADGEIYFAITDADGNTLLGGLDGREFRTGFSYDFSGIRYQVYTEDGKPAAEKGAPKYGYTADAGILVALYLTGKPVMTGNLQLLEMLAAHVSLLVTGLIVSLLLFAVCAVYLCCSAGRSRGREGVRAAGFNVLPLDLYFAGILFAFAAGMMLLDEVDLWLTRQTMLTLVMILAGFGYILCLLFVCFCFACAAQFKMGKAHWFWNSIAGRCLHLTLWIAKKVWRLAPRLIRDAWKVASSLLALAWGMASSVLSWLGRVLRRVLRSVERFFSRLPLIWQWLCCGTLIVIILGYLMNNHGGMGVIYGVLACLAIVLYGANCFGALLGAVKKLRAGELETKVDDKYLVGSFREFADELNGLGDAAVVAAQKQLKSERMKTELITNVSHDIKTPLTSIINYVDLLEKPHTPEQEKMYLEVLSRQSQRMKKLIEDLMEMSKAATGNIPVEIIEIDAVEAVTQALGEFSDKLTAAGLTPVFSQSAESVFLLADGRLLWRAMSNVLSNAVKYALPGTRFYVDVTALEDKAVISFKNISGAQLNISADELMERFVRGDSSRNTEGSGLGLNIAKSLMELQKGQLHLLVDGDLFKVTLVFPRAK